MKIKAKFVRPAPLDTIQDSTDGARAAIRPVAQTVRGLKTFKGMNVAGDPVKDDKSLVNYGDLIAAWDDGRPISIAETVELTAEHIAGKSVTLRLVTGILLSRKARCKAALSNSRPLIR